MQGLMSERPLLVSAIIKHAAIYHRDTEIVSRTVEGPINRYTYAEAERRSMRLARALMRLGINPGDRVAPSLPAECRIVLMTEEDAEPPTNFPKLACYERLIAAEDEYFEWPEFDERTAASLCYTS